MAKDHWFKFYADAWLADEGLVACSFASQGVFMRMLCLMHKSSERGYLLAGSMVPTMDKLSRMLGSNPVELLPLLVELCDTQVLSKDEKRTACDGTILYFSKRMVRDTEQSETNSENGRKGWKTKSGGLSEIEAVAQANSDERLKRKSTSGLSEPLTLTLTSNSNSEFPEGGAGETTAHADEPAVRAEIRNAVASEWFSGGITAGQRDRFDALVAEFSALSDATPSEIAARRHAARNAWEVKSVSPEALLKHWGAFNGNADRPSSNESPEFVAAMIKLGLPL